MCMTMATFPHKPHKFYTVKVNKWNPFTESIGYFHPPPPSARVLFCHNSLSLPPFLFRVIGVPGTSH